MTANGHVTDPGQRHHSVDVATVDGRRSPRHARPAGPRSLRGTWQLVGIVAALSAVTQWLTLPRPLHGDPLNVFAFAAAWPDVPLHHQAMRIGLLIPSRLVQEVVGYNQAAYTITALGLGVVAAVGTLLLGRVMFGAVPALVAAVLMVLNPLYLSVDYAAGQVLPDLPTGGLLALGLSAVWAAPRLKGRRQAVVLVAAGVALGSAYLVREFAVLVFPLVVTTAWCAGLRTRQLLLVAAGALGCLAVDLLNGVLVYGDALARLSTTEHGGTPKPGAEVGRWDAFDKIAVALDGMPFEAGFWVLLTLLVVATLVTRDRRLVVLLGWFASFYLPFSLLSGGLDPDRISLRAELTRYWYVIFPPVIVGGVAGARLLWGLARSRLRRGRRVADVAAGLVGASFCLVWLGVAASIVVDHPRDTAWNELRHWASTEADRSETLWIDTRGRQTFRLYDQQPWARESYWAGDVRSFPQRSRIGEEVAADGILVETLFGPRPRPHEDFGWTRVWESTDGSIVVWRR